ncbi:hypothetical protein SEA_HONK_48 [Microbacterium phage Honk]|uniref:Uncharacterized protein n=1 Tax=Microbacterium phage Honk TaxID=2836095 RepID=A0A8F3E5L1_9CAUD|nr:hypothetical protein SEA_HONK_48 [Microbacterium phage Honk]
MPHCFIDLRDHSALLVGLIGHDPDAELDIDRLVAEARAKEGRPLDPAEEWLRHLDALLAEGRHPEPTLRQARELADALRARGLHGLTSDEVARLALRARRWRAAHAAYQDTVAAILTCEPSQSAALLSRMVRLAQLLQFLR